MQISEYLTTLNKTYSFEPNHQQKSISQFKDTTFRYNDIYEYNKPYIATMATFIKSFHGSLFMRKQLN